MKNRMSVRELKAYCTDHAVNEVLFSTENQRWYQTSDPCKVQMNFKIMLIGETPNLVCLKSEAGSICFDRVRFVEVDTDITVLGTVLYLYCGGKSAASPEITYTLIIR